MKKLPFVMLSLAALAFVGCNSSGGGDDTQSTSTNTTLSVEDSSNTTLEDTTIKDTVEDTVENTIENETTEDIEDAQLKAYKAATDRYNTMSPYEVTSLDVVEYANDFVVDGDYIYIVAAQNGLQVVKIEDNDTLSPISSLETNDAKDIAISNTYAYIADGDEGLKIIDISDPFSPKLVGNVDTDESAFSVLVDGDYAYLSADGLNVIDISDKTNPTIVGYNESDTNTLLKKDNYIYSNGKSFDVSDPKNPTLVDSISDNQFKTIVRDHIITTTSTIDITDPTNMQKDNSFTNLPLIYTRDPYNGNIFPANQVEDIKVVDNIGYVTKDLRGLLLLDMNDLSNITNKATLQYDLNSWVTKVEISDGFAYLLITKGFIFDSARTISKVNIDSKTSPIVPQMTELIHGDKLVDGEYLYNVSVSDDNLTISSIADKTNITLLSSLMLNEPLVDSLIAKAGNTLFYIYRNDTSYGIASVDVSESDNPKNIATLDINGELRDIKIVGNYAYIAALDEGLKIVDISDAQNMKLIGSLDEDLNYARKIDIKDNYLFAANDKGGTTGIAVVDISDVANPIFIKRFTTSMVRNIKIDGNYLYASVYDGGLGDSVRIYDITKPTEPIKTTKVDPSLTYADGYGSMEVVGNYLIVPEREDFVVIDVTSKEFPKQVDHYNISVGVQQVSGDYLFTGMYMFDISGLKEK